MKNFNKTTLALAFSVFGALTSMSAIAMSSVEHKEQLIEILADDTKNVQVFVSNDGDITELELTKDALEDKAELEAALAGLPDDIRDKVLKQLTNIKFDANMIKIHTEEGSDHHGTWVESDAEHVIVLKSSDGADASNIAKQMVKKFKHGDGHAKVIQFKHGGKLGAGHIVKLLEHGEFTADDLDKIQQALDAKR